MSTNLLYNFFGATHEMEIQVRDLGFKKIHEVPPVEFLNRKIDPWIPSEIGLQSYLNRVEDDSTYNVDHKYEADYENFDELIGPHAQQSFNSRRGVIRVMQQTKPMGSISMFGVPRLINGKTNDLMAQLGNMVDVCSVAFYRRGHSEKGMHERGVDKSVQNMQYAAQWKHKPLMVVISPFWMDENKNFHIMSMDEINAYLTMIYDVEDKSSDFENEIIRIDSLYCWSNALRLIKNSGWEKHVLGIESQKELEDYLLKFLEDVKSFVSNRVDINSFPVSQVAAESK